MDWVLIHVVWDPEAISLVFSNGRHDLASVVVDTSTGGAVIVGGSGSAELGRFEPVASAHDFDQLGGIDVLPFIQRVLGQVTHITL